MSETELRSAMEFLSARFVLLRHEDGEGGDIDWVLDRARVAVARYGVRGLVIDPYNELEHLRPRGRTETEYVSEMLSKVKRFAQNHGVHVWFVAHPRQLHGWDDDVPSLYDIAGSAHFVNKADNGIVVHRYRNPDSGKLGEVEIHMLKARNKLAGRLGVVSLNYNVVTGIYSMNRSTRHSPS